MIKQGKDIDVSEICYGETLIKQVYKGVNRIFNYGFDKDTLATLSDSNDYLFMQDPWVTNFAIDKSRRNNIYIGGYNYGNTYVGKIFSYNITNHKFVNPIYSEEDFTVTTMCIDGDLLYVGGQKDTGNNNGFKYKLFVLDLYDNTILEEINLGGYLNNAHSGIISILLDPMTKDLYMWARNTSSENLVFMIIETTTYTAKFRKEYQQEFSEDFRAFQDNNSVYFLLQEKRDVSTYDAKLIAYSKSTGKIESERVFYTMVDTISDFDIVFLAYENGFIYYVLKGKKSSSSFTYEFCKLKVTTLTVEILNSTLVWDTSYLQITDTSYYVTDAYAEGYVRKYAKNIKTSQTFRKDVDGTSSETTFPFYQDDEYIYCADSKSVEFLSK